jgi:transposase InsO family protein
MEKLTEQQQELIKKMSTARLISKLIIAGWSVEEVEKLERPGLIKAWAELVATGKDHPPAKAVKGEGAELKGPEIRLGYDLELERKRLEFEMHRWEVEQAEKSRREELEAKRLAEERDERARRMEIELRRLDLEAKRMDEEKTERGKQLKELELQNELKRQELQRQEAQDRVEREKREATVSRVKRFDDAIHHAMSRMPNDPIELVDFFDSLEKLYVTFEVPDDLKVTLLRPYLNDRARSLLTRFDLMHDDDYDSVKQFLLHEFHLSPLVYLERFQRVMRGNDDTYVLFCSKLKALLEYYLRSRKIKDTNDPSYARLISLLVSDRIKSTLPDHVMKHILAIEANNADGWLSHTELSEAIDLYMANHWFDGKPRGGAFGSSSGNRPTFRSLQGQQSNANQSRQSVGNRFGNDASDVANGATRKDNSGKSASGPKLCHRCGSAQHLVANCPLKSNAQPVQGQGSRGSNRDGGNFNRTARVNTAQGAVTANVSSNVTPVKQLAAPSQTPGSQTLTTGTTSSDNSANASVYELRASEIAIRDPHDEFIDAVCGYNDLDEPVDKLISVGNVITHANQGEDVVGSRNNVIIDADVEFAQLHHIDINIKGISDTVKGLEDSRAQLCVVRSDLIKDLSVERIGSVKLRGIFGSPVQADLVRLHLKLANEPSISYVPVICAVCADIHEELILNVDVVNRLSICRDALSVCDNTVDNAIVSNEVDVMVRGEVIADNVNDECINDDNEHVGETTSSSQVLDTVTDEELMLRRANADELRAEQLADDTLANCWSLAKTDKGDFFIRDGILYHRDNILGQPVSQLVLPVKRRSEILRLAHNIHGGHMTFRKSRDRIRFSFYWPSLKADLLRHLQCCRDCQLRARITYRDRVSITPIPRAQTPFTHWVMDCFGPILGNQMAEYPYCLLSCCSATRFPWASPLRSLSAKSVCDALLHLFSITGVASQCFVSSDQGPNFTAQITREFLKRLGVSPRFNTPGHPQASGLCERLVQSTKNIISKLAHNSPRSWHKYVDAAMWALREVPNETTGVAPYMLVFGHLPKGPLAILKEHWRGETDLPLDLGKSTADQRWVID